MQSSKKPQGRNKLTWLEYAKRVGFFAVITGVQIPKAAVEIAYRRHEPAGDVCARAYEHAKRNGKRGAK
jgi:hypothetical protein